MAQPFRIAVLAGLMLNSAVLAQSSPTPSPLSRTAWTTSRIAGTPVPPAPYRIRPAFPEVRFDHPTSLLEIPGQDRLLVTEMSGKIFSLSKSVAAAKPELIVDLEKHTGSQVSLFSATLHPKFTDNRFVFISYVHPADKRQVRISRFTITSDIPGTIVPTSEAVFLLRPSGPHNAGDLKFGNDGLLYASTGDGAGPNPPDSLTTGQDISDLLGSILRIDVDRPSGALPYSIPIDNPFRDTPGARGEIWSYGLRNPWKFGIDRLTNEVFVADNGWETWELIHRIERGGNCGWPIMEGRAALRSEVPLGPTPIIPPVKDHPHSEANSVIGGPVYRGNKLIELQGAFVYGDYITGTIWALWPDATTIEPTKTFKHATLVDTDLQIVSFAEGSAGELYVLDYDFTGQIYELLPSGLKDNSAKFPRKLSETGLFRSLDDLEPSPGVIPYSVTVSQWMDGADASRWIAIPGLGSVDLSAQDHARAFPDGTVLVKHLSLPVWDKQPIRLETQLLHFEEGSWNPYSYLWDDEGKEANLVSEIGSMRSLRVEMSNGRNEERTWRVNAVNECRLCHNAGANVVLGFVPQQLDRPLVHLQKQLVGPTTSTQLPSLVSQRVVSGPASLEGSDSRRLVDPHDMNQSIEDRARSYLHANCSMCHHPRGNAIVSFFLRRDMPFDQLRTDKGTIIGTFGVNNGKVIAAGDPYRSLLVYRMSKLGYARMPYIGSHAVDGKGIALIEQWIRSLIKSDEFKSAPLTPGSPEHSALDVLDGKSGDRSAAIRELARTTEGSLALLERVHLGRLNKTELDLAIETGSGAASSDIVGLYEAFLPESKRRARLGSNIQPSQILSLRGDNARGKLIYYSDTARCRACHDQTDISKSLGPTLAEINKKYPEASEMLLHVLEPSRKIEDRFATITILTSRGQNVSGLVVAEDEKSISVKTNELKTVRILRSEIEESKKSSKSLMPDGVLSDLTGQEAADLVAYIRGL